MSVRWSWSVARLGKDDGPPEPGFCASISRRRNMEAEEVWKKNPSSHKLLDKKVPCRQNGRIGKTAVLKQASFNQSPSHILLSLQQGDLSSAGIVRSLHSLLKTQNTLQIQSITRAECTGGWKHHYKTYLKVESDVFSLLCRLEKDGSDVGLMQHHVTLTWGLLVQNIWKGGFCGAVCWRSSGSCSLFPSATYLSTLPWNVPF